MQGEWRCAAVPVEAGLLAGLQAQRLAMFGVDVDGAFEYGNGDIGTGLADGEAGADGLDAAAVGDDPEGAAQGISGGFDQDFSGQQA